MGYLYGEKKNGQTLAQTSRKWHKKYQFGESGGERKINPSANKNKTEIL